MFLKLYVLKESEKDDIIRVVSLLLKNFKVLFNNILKEI